MIIIPLACNCYDSVNLVATGLMFGPIVKVCVGVRMYFLLTTLLCIKTCMIRCVDFTCTFQKAHDIEAATLNQRCINFTTFIQR